jgi:hypothetical protein
MKAILILASICMIFGTYSVHAQCLCFPKQNTYNVDSLFAIDTCLVPNDVSCDSILLIDNPSKYNRAIYTKLYDIIFDSLNYFPFAALTKDSIIVVPWQQIDTMFSATRAGFAALEARFGSFLIYKVLRKDTSLNDLLLRSAGIKFSNFQLGDSLYEYVRAISGIVSGQPIPAFIDNQTSIKEYLDNQQKCVSIIPQNGILPVPEIARRKGWQLVNIIGQTVRSYEGESLDETVNLSAINSGVYFAIFPNCTSLILLTGDNQ